MHRSSSPPPFPTVHELIAERAWVEDELFDVEFKLEQSRGVREDLEDKKASLEAENKRLGQRIVKLPAPNT